MANEATVFSEGTTNCIVRYFTVANANALAKGALLEKSGDRTGITHSGGVDDVPLGFIVEEKEALDGKTTIGCQRTGVVTAITAGTVTTGDIVGPGATANTVSLITGGSLSTYAASNILGRALETSTTGLACKIALTLG